MLAGFAEQKGVGENIAGGEGIGGFLAGAPEAGFVRDEIAGDAGQRRCRRGGQAEGKDKERNQREAAQPWRDLRDGFQYTIWTPVGGAASQNFPSRAFGRTYNINGWWNEAVPGSKAGKARLG